jgi:hypothetical protein
MGQAKLLGGIVILALLIVGSFSMFTVHERVVFQNAFR